MDLLIEWGYHESFLKEAKKQIIELLNPICSPFIKMKLLYVSLNGYQINERKFQCYKFLDVNIKPCHVVLKNMELYWKSEDDTIVFPSDDVSNKKITFWIENIPSDEEIQEKFARHEYLWKKEKTEYLIDKKHYRFKIKEFGWFSSSFPDITIKIKSTASLDSLNAVVGKAISTFNKEGEINEGENGLVHYFDSKKKKKNVYAYIIDTGSSLIGGVEAILKALNDSDLDTEVVTLG